MRRYNIGDDMIEMDGTTQLLLKGIL